MKDRRIKTNVRIITSSQLPLDHTNKNNHLNSSLYALLKPFSIYLPPLKERKEDFKILIDDIKQRLNRNDLTFSNEVMQFFNKYKWPGNIKELYNVISYLSCLENQTIDINSLPIYLRNSPNQIHIENQFSNNEYEKIVNKIEEHCFLDEGIEILKVLHKGKQELKSYGRLSLKKELKKMNITFTEQQLRLRLEVLNELKLIIVRQGRGGSTISRFGEDFLDEHLNRLEVVQYSPFL